MTLEQRAIVITMTALCLLIAFAILKFIQNDKRLKREVSHLMQFELYQLRATKSAYEDDIKTKPLSRTQEKSARNKIAVLTLAISIKERNHL